MINNSSFVGTNRETLLYLLLFLTASIPYIHIGPVSLSMIFGIVLILHCRYLYVGGELKPFIFFLIISIGSLLFSPVALDFDSLYTISQIAYWGLLVCSVYRITPKLNIKTIANASIVAVLLNGIVFYCTDNKTMDNAISYIIVSTWPLGLFVLKHRLRKIIYFVLVFICQIIIGSRTGILLVLLQVMVMIFLKWASRKHTIIALSVIVALLAIFQSSRLRNTFCDIFLPQDSEMSVIIREPEVVFMLDKSWAQRVIQQQKCKQIFREHPLLGIGPLNVPRYNVNIKYVDSNIDDRVLAAEYLHSDNRSTHNSYFQIIAEVGILGTLCLVMFLGLIFKNMYLWVKQDEFALLLFSTLIGMLLNLFMISSFWGTNTLILLGLSAGYVAQLKNKPIHN